MTTRTTCLALVALTAAVLVAFAVPQDGGMPAPLEHGRPLLSDALQAAGDGAGTHGVGGNEVFGFELAQRCRAGEGPG